MYDILSSFCFRDPLLNLDSTSYFCWACLRCEYKRCLDNIYTHYINELLWNGKQYHFHCVKWVMSWNIRGPGISRHPANHTSERDVSEHATCRRVSCYWHSWHGVSGQVVVWIRQVHRIMGCQGCDTNARHLRRGYHFRSLPYGNRNLWTLVPRSNMCKFFGLNAVHRTWCDFCNN